MSKNYNLITNIPFEKVTGPVLFNLTNDYMFKATLQECTEARVGLIAAILGTDPSTIEAEVTNPIELGKSVSSKDFYLDVKVIVNKIKTMNLEMQVEKMGDWDKRSLSYSFRSYDQLCKGENYKDVLPFHQVGFTCFDTFKENNKFFETFCMTSKDSDKIYTDTFLLSVVNLKRIDEATEKDRQYKLDKWCRFITASTWEELKDLAKEDPNMQAAAEKLYLLSSDFEIREEAIRRRDYYNYVHSLEEEIAKKDATLAERDATLAEKEATLAEKEAEKEAAINEKDKEIAELKRIIEELKK